MIWNSTHLHADRTAIRAELENYIWKPEQLSPKDENPIYIAIVGGGPKGFYALERLLAILNNRQFAISINIHWYNNNSNFAAGPNYQMDLPNYLLTNNCIADVNCWETEDFLHFTAKNLNLMEWIHDQKIIDQEVLPNQYCTRELMGYYLTDSLLKVLKQKIEQVEVSLIQCEIEDLQIDEYEVRLFQNKEIIPFKYESVILTTGHSYFNSIQESLQNNLPDHIHYLDSPYPIERLDNIPAKAEIAVKGLGLTFIDTILHLTEGRGGIFYKKENNYEYICSGKEPIIYPFSTTNLPMLPRNAFWKNHKLQLKFMTDDWLNKLMIQERQISFEEEILPILNLEIQWAFYSRLDYMKSLSEEELLNFIKHGESNKKFSINALIDPFTYSNVDKSANYNEFVMDLCIYCMKLTELDELESHFSAAIAALREGFEQLSNLYNFNGFLPESQRNFDQNWIRHFHQIGYGPPRESIEKFFCLLKNGIIKFVFSEMPEIYLEEDNFILKNQYVEKKFNFLLDARVPKGNLKEKNNALFHRLFDKGIIKEQVNQNYETGKIAIEKDGKLSGLPEHLIIYIYGTGTEGTVLNNDTLSRDRHNFGTTWALKTVQKLESKYPGSRKLKSLISHYNNN